MFKTPLGKKNIFKINKRYTTAIILTKKMNKISPPVQQYSMVKKRLSSHSQFYIVYKLKIRRENRKYNGNPPLKKWPRLTQAKRLGPK
jgi:hypothetical protein